MEKKLRENDYKKHWSNCDHQYLLNRLKEEVTELEKPMWDVIEEAADVANFAMMIADNERRLLQAEKKARG